VPGRAAPAAAATPSPLSTAAARPSSVSLQQPSHPPSSQLPSPGLASSASSASRSPYTPSKPPSPLEALLGRLDARLAHQPFLAGYAAPGPEDAAAFASAVAGGGLHALGAPGVPAAGRPASGAWATHPAAARWLAHMAATHDAAARARP
jgi:glutathione S-transferase